MTLKGTLDSLTKFAEKIDSILGKLKWFGIVGTLLISASHYKACNDRDFYQREYTKVKAK